MSLIRGFASGLLRTATRYSPAETRDWASAMLRELDSIESDWAALLWATGGMSVAFRSVGRALKGSLGTCIQEKGQLKKGIAKQVAGAVSGILIAAVLAICAYGLYRFFVHSFPSIEMGRVPWVAWLTVIAVPEMTFIAFVVGQWRRNRSMAVGIMLSGTVLAVHFAIHIMNHWNG